MAELHPKLGGLAKVTGDICWGSAGGGWSWGGLSKRAISWEPVGTFAKKGISCDILRNPKVTNVWVSSFWPAVELSAKSTQRPSADAKC